LRLYSGKEDQIQKEEEKERKKEQRWRKSVKKKEERNEDRPRTQAEGPKMRERES